MRSDGELAVLVPVKSFSDAKERLASVLDETERQDLARLELDQPTL